MRLQGLWILSRVYRKSHHATARVRKMMTNRIQHNRLCCRGLDKRHIFFHRHNSTTFNTPSWYSRLSVNTQGHSIRNVSSETFKKQDTKQDKCDHNEKSNQNILQSVSSFMCVDFITHHSSCFHLSFSLEIFQ